MHKSQSVQSQNTKYLMHSVLPRQLSSVISSLRPRLSSLIFSLLHLPTAELLLLWFQQSFLPQSSVSCQSSSSAFTLACRCNIFSSLSAFSFAIFSSCSAFNFAIFSSCSLFYSSCSLSFAFSSHYLALSSLCLACSSVYFCCCLVTNSSSFSPARPIFVLFAH